MWGKKFKELTVIFETQPGLISRWLAMLAPSVCVAKRLHLSTHVYPSWDGNYGPLKSNELEAANAAVNSTRCNAQLWFTPGAGMQGA
jgi:hypothetical protein